MNNKISKILIVIPFTVILSGCAVNTESLETFSKEEQQSITEYELVYKLKASPVLNELHYELLSGDQSQENIEKIMLEIRESCADLCNISIWDSRGFIQTTEGTDLTIEEYVIKNKDHLIGYYNSGDLFWFMGEEKGFLLPR